MSGQATWTAVDEYAGATVIHEDDALRSSLRAAEAAGLPAINVSPAQGKMLHLMARAARATRILEIGTLAAYSTIWLARALMPGGRLISLELHEHHAAVARANLKRAGVDAMAEVRVGRAIDLLPGVAADMQAAGAKFDFVFIDADKPSNPDYFSWAVRLTRSGGVIVVDNVVRDGAVIDERSADPAVVGVRALHDSISRDPRVSATVIQTVGLKGYDGFTMAVVN